MCGATFAAASGGTRTTRRQSRGAPARSLPKDGHVASFLKNVKKWEYTKSWDMFPPGKDGCVVKAVEVRAREEIGVSWRWRGQQRRRRSILAGNCTEFLVCVSVCRYVCGVCLSALLVCLLFVCRYVCVLVCLSVCVYRIVYFVCFSCLSICMRVCLFRLFFLSACLYVRSVFLVCLSTTFSLLPGKLLGRRDLAPKRRKRCVSFCRYPTRGAPLRSSPTRAPFFRPTLPLARYRRYPRRFLGLSLTVLH